MNSTPHNTTFKRTLTALLLSLSSLSQASTVASQWYFGNWNCLIDGRAARMVWQVVDDPQTSCSGGVCSSSSGVAIKGWFKDGNGSWVTLNSQSVSRNDFRFTYTGDNTRWFLRYDPATRSAVGNTIWNGNAYSLSCRK
jgi:glucan-binding YG repeat protein